PADVCAMPPPPGGLGSFHAPTARSTAPRVGRSADPPYQRATVRAGRSCCAARGSYARLLVERFSVWSACGGCAQTILSTRWHFRPLFSVSAALMRTARTLPFASESQITAATGALRFARSMAALLTWGSAVDGRLLLIGAVIVYLAIIAAGRLVWGVDVWPFLGVPSGASLFFDARNPTAAWESSRLGYDPLYISPRDPWGRPLMYLRPWLLLGALGL